MPTRRGLSTGSGSGLWKTSREVDSTPAAFYPRQSMELSNLARSLGCAGALALIPSAAWGQVQTAPETPVTTRVMALGGGGHAIAQSTSSLYVNPAAMSQSRVYHVDSSVLWDPSQGRWSFGGAVVDSSRTVGAGLAYHYSLLDGDTRNHDLRVAVAVTLTEGVSLGVTGRYIDYVGVQSHFQDNMGVAGARIRGAEFSGFTVDAGISLKPWSWLALGITGYSLSNPDTALSPLSIGGGIGIIPVDTLHIIADTVWDLTSFADGPRARWSGGVELLASRVPLRLGYTYDDIRLDHPVHLVTAGLGYIDQMFAAEFSMRQEVSGGSQTTLLLNLRYFHRLL
jgi:hypothetical protein